MMTALERSSSEPAPKLIGLLGFDGIAAPDLTGPLEALSIARFPGEPVDGPPCYKAIILGLTNKIFAAESGLVFKADLTVDCAPPLDTILIPGGKGLRQPETMRRAASWLADRASSTRRIAAVSTGVYALGLSGLADGQSVTTHWRFSRDVSQRFPKLRVNHAASFLKNDRIYTSAGGTAGVEMTLALIEEDFGRHVARTIARELVMRLRPAGEVDDYFQAVNYQSDPAERVTDLPAWILAHLHERITVDALAERACLCPRHFSRLFKQVFNCTPADFVEELRLTEARRRLLGLRTPVGSVAESVGFKSSDAFRRAFERRVGVTPSAFRRHAGGAIPPKVVRHERQPALPMHAYLKHAKAA
jgi:transcriptional regulator GlxA family with amidase domain